MDTLIAFIITLIILDALIGFIVYRRIVKTCIGMLPGYSRDRQYAEVQTNRVMGNRKLWTAIALGVGLSAAVIVYRSRA